MRHWPIASGGKGAPARPRRSPSLAFLLAFAAVAGASQAASPAAPESAAAPAQIRLIAANAAASTAVFAIDGVLQSVKGGDRVRATPLRLVHVGTAGVLIERADAGAGRVARLQLAVGATLPDAALESPLDIPPDRVPARTSVVVQSRSVQSRQGADTDAPIQ